MNSIDIITSENNGSVFIQSDFIAYQNDDNDVIYITCEDVSNYRSKLLHLSELKKCLTNRDWDIGDKKFLRIDKTTSRGDWSGEVFVMTSPQEYIETITSSTYTVGGVSLINTETRSTLSLESDVISAAETLISQHNMNNSEIYLYDVSKKTIDLLNSSITVDIILPGSESYTDTVSIKNYMSQCNIQNTSSKIDLGIQYSKGGDTYTYSTTFEGFNNSSSLVGSSFDFINKVSDSNIVLEYIDGIIQVLPADYDVTECIISKCIITYGNLN